MPQIVKKRRSGWAILAVGALVASLLAVGSAPAGAAEIKTGDANTASAEVEPAYKACVGDALEDAGFTDLGTLEDAARDINCLKYYKITTGKTDDTFDPNSNVTRSQMALFLYRAASAAGVDLMGGDGDADFGDIAELGEDRQNAIKALARNNILAGRSDMAFDPSGDITRAEMAVALVGLLRHAKDSLFNADGSLKGVTGLDYFADARASVPVAVDTAISQAYELGITTGRSNATFGPNDGVPRRNMASFIIRTLNHTNVRPGGVSVQRLDTGDIRVSVRDSDFAPVPNAAVDMFKVKTARIGDAFADDGSCTRLPVVVEGDGSSRCKISGDDLTTNLEGNLLTSGINPPADGDTLFVWTGPDDAAVDGDTPLFRLEIVKGATAARADSVLVTTDLPEGSKALVDSQEASCGGTDIACSLAPYGSTVTYTIQLQDSTETPAVDAGPPTGGAKFNVKVTYPSGVVTINEVSVDESGSASFTVSVADSNPRALDNADVDNVTVSRTAVEITPVTNARGIYLPAGDKDGDGNPTYPTPAVALMDTSQVRFTDLPSVITTVNVSTNTSYRLAPDGTTRNSVTVTVLDQYGEGMPGVLVKVAAGATAPSAAPGAGEGVTRTTISNGQSRPYYSKAAGAASEMIVAFADGDRSTPGFQTQDATPSMSTAFHWVVEPTETTDEVTGALLAGDPSTGALVINNDGTPTLVVFDSNDQFTVTDADLVMTGNQAGYGMEEFVKAVSRADSLTGKTNNLDVTVTGNGYNPNDSAAVTNWTAS